MKLKGGEGPVAVTLDRYRLPVGGLVTAEDRGYGGGEVQAEVERYLADDPLCLVKCWSVDWDHDGQIHRASALLPGMERSCQMACEEAASKAVSDGNGAGRIVSVVGYDVFGGRFETVARR